jgi:organic hydroperoxide reductase OsmC/OhrA
MSHVFEVQVSWREGLRGEAAATGVDQKVPFSVPAEFGGPGGEWTPEHFFTAGINCCVMATFLSISQLSKLAIVSYEAKATARMEKTEGGLLMTRVELRPRIGVASDKDRERALRMIEKAEKMCPISNSVKAVVSLEATVEVAAS